MNMNWKDFQTTLKRQRLTQTSFGSLAGVNPQIISRWRRRVKGVPAWARTILALRAGLFRKQKQVQRLARIAYPRGRA